MHFFFRKRFYLSILSILSLRFSLLLGWFSSKCSKYSSSFEKFNYSILSLRFSLLLGWFSSKCSKYFIFFYIYWYKHTLYSKTSISSVIFFITTNTSFDSVFLHWEKFNYSVFTLRFSLLLGWFSSKCSKYSSSLEESLITVFYTEILTTSG